jgi:cell division protease FtsH
VALRPGSGAPGPARADDRDWGRIYRSALFPLIIIVLLVYLASQTILPTGPDADEIAYSEAKAIVEDRPQTVQNVVFQPGSKRLEMELTDGRRLEAHYPSDLSALEFERLLDQRGIRHESRGSGDGDSALWSILIYLLPFVLFMGFWVFLMRRSQEKGADRRRGEWEGEPRGQADDTGTHPDAYR